jgi:hypothetical protein
MAKKGLRSWVKENWVDIANKRPDGSYPKCGRSGGEKRKKYPKDTVKIKFATPADARATVAKVKRVKKPFARKIQILTVMEQRAKVMGKSQVASIARKGKEAIRNATNRKR